MHAAVAAMRMAGAEMHAAVAATRMAGAEMHVAVAATRMAGAEMHVAVAATRMAGGEIRLLRVRTHAAAVAMRMAGGEMQVAAAAMRMAGGEMHVAVAAMRVFATAVRVAIAAARANFVATLNAWDKLLTVSGSGKDAIHYVEGPRPTGGPESSAAFDFRKTKPPRIGTPLPGPAPAAPPDHRESCEGHPRGTVVVVSAGSHDTIAGTITNMLSGI